MAFGVNNGGKQSVDVTYLRAAEETGNLRIETLHVVRDLALNDQRLWELLVDRIEADGTIVERKTIVSDAVFLNAGSTGTLRLLVKARAKGLIPYLPDAVGTQWGNNGDRIYSWIGMDADIGTRKAGRRASEVAIPAAHPVRSYPCWIADAAGRHEDDDRRRIGARRRGRDVAVRRKH